MEARIPIPHGKYKGKYIESLPDFLVNAIYQAWMGRELKNDPFFSRIQDEMFCRNLLDKHGDPRTKVNFKNLSPVKKKRKKRKVVRAEQKPSSCSCAARIDELVVAIDRVRELIKSQIGDEWYDENCEFIEEVIYQRR